ncbi:MAG: DUF3617 domain-containing protein [Acidobacteriia bacterium]|nr:DUF3617 domain-containing protein [Terriglobia bacterium]
MMLNQLFLPTLVLFMFAAPVMTDNLNIKPGLWEFTSTTQSKGAPPISAQEKAEMEKAMANMPPDRRAKMEAAMKAAQGGAARPHVHKSCVTKEDLSKPLDMGDDKECKKTILKSTSREQDIRVDCTSGTHKSSGTMHFIANNSESVSGAMDMQMSDTGGAMTVKMNFSGKWLGASCGDVKPMSHK